MAFDELLASRIRPLFTGFRFEEKRMFGGLTFLVNGHVCCGVANDVLVLRVGPEGEDEALSQPHARPADFTGRPMKGMICVDPQGFRGEAELRDWLERALRFALSLAPKPAERSRNYRGGPGGRGPGPPVRKSKR